MISAFKVISFGLFLGAALAPLAPKAEHGWACIENGSMIQKYRLSGDQLVEEGDPFTRLLKRDAKVAGKPYEPEGWKILVNNKDGLIAVLAAVSRKSGSPEVYADTLMIDKATGRYRHLSATIGGKITDESGGSCTDY